MKITKKMFTPNKRKAGKQPAVSSSPTRRSATQAHLPVATDENQDLHASATPTRSSRKANAPGILQPLPALHAQRGGGGATASKPSLFARSKVRKAVVDDLWQGSTASSPLPQLLEDMDHLLRQQPKLPAPLHAALAQLHNRALHAEEGSNQMKSDVMRQKLNYTVFLQRSTELAQEQDHILSRFVAIVNQINDSAAVQRLSSQHDALHQELSQMMAAPLPVVLQQALQNAAQRLHKTATLTNRLQQDLTAERLSRPVFLQAQQHLQDSMQRQHRALQSIRQQISLAYNQLPAYEASPQLPAYAPGR